MVFKRRIHTRTVSRWVGFFALIVFSQISTGLLLRNEFRTGPISPFSGNRIRSPYSDTNLKWLKTAIHLHSDRDGFSPFRSPPEEIQNRYSEKGYDLIGITDYLKISGVDSGSKTFLPGYEWGRDFNKKHILAIGADTVTPDFFPMYAAPGNIQWTVDRMQKSGAFVVVAHPALEGSVPEHTIERLRGIDAIEVFSPYGIFFAEWIRLLDRGIAVNAFSGDDLHYFPGESIRAMKLPLYKRIFHELTFSDQNEGEPFTRYILLNSDSLGTKDVVRNLKQGNYVSVIKTADYLEDPGVNELRLDGDRIIARFPEKFLKLEFIGSQGRILASETESKSAYYRFTREDSFVIVKVIFASGLLYSNAFFRKES
ncbi:phosphoesterase [Leptospira gomenensis]|uniref:Phosphoesterase n=1 Tax=Leptospira gomenensis TaxID=2484974 RepID=A0A5F1YTB9_9LEPT|nr:phosphoesterase [Leptospira gomenensis]TGK38688.1 phosphoesterase [Leptospira gomenensis]TGK44340.1 phosphoesterase [Leptospira gomenensis]TGK49626.1 phosphoesterase [Leptospira gomenensis]TGK60812.1 phosphoesterase [Leptospira gomenensis]